MSRFSSEFKAGGDQRDPFGDAISLLDFNGQLDDLASALKSDRNAFDEATRAVHGAELELAAANKLVVRSINDQIPDSLTIKRCQDEVSALEAELESISNRLKIAHENWQMVDEVQVRLGDRGPAEASVVPVPAVVRRASAGPNGNNRRMTWTGKNAHSTFG